MKKLLILSLLLLLPVGAFAQEGGSWNFAYLYDVDDTNANYCILRGHNGGTGPGTTWRLGGANIKTTGSSQTVTTVTAGAEPFAGMAVGDVIRVNRGADEAVDVVTIITYTDANNVTVSSAVNWGRTNGYGFAWLDLDCGTAATDGWLDVTNYTGRTVGIQFEQGDYTGGLDVSVQAKSCALGANPVQIFPENNAMTTTAAAAALHNFAQAKVGTVEARGALNIPEPWCYVRVRLSGNGTDTADTTTTKEEITVWFSGQRTR